MKCKHKAIFKLIHLPRNGNGKEYKQNYITADSGNGNIIEKKYNPVESQKAKTWIMGLLKENGILGIVPCDTMIKTSLEM